MGENLSQEDIQDLKKQGYSSGDIQKALEEIEKEELNESYNNVQQKRDDDPRKHSQLSSFSAKTEDNIVRWQLELNDILERAEHILRGDIPKFREGHIIWSNNPYPKLNTLNEVGVQEIMKILSMYVNRNKVLSDYSNEEINIKVFDFGRALNNLIFMRDYEMDMDTEEKRKNYDMLVNELKDIIHDTYKRALDGAEKRSLREMITVSQQTSTNSNIGGGYGVNNNGQVSKERGLLNPMRYVSGKYK